MRVMGSHAMSTRFLASGVTSSRIATWFAPFGREGFRYQVSGFRFSLADVCGLMPSLRPPPWVVAGRQFLLVVAPLGFLVDRIVGHGAQLADDGSVGLHQGRGDLAARRLVHERHELVREARHRAADAD